MTQEIEILLKKEMFNKTFKNILPVRVWSSKEDVNILGKKITISIRIDMKSATISFIPSIDDVKGILTCTLKGTANAGGFDVDMYLPGDVSTDLQATVESDFSSMTITIPDNKVHIKTAIAGVAVFDEDVDMDLSQVKIIIPLMSQMLLAIPEPMNKKIILKAENAKLSSTTNGVLASANMTVE